MTSRLAARCAVFCLALFAFPATYAQESTPETPGGQSSGTPPIWGIADTHSHMFSNLGFGGVVVWGSPFNAGGIALALPSCEHLHGPLGVDDHPGIVAGQGLLHFNGGYPDFWGWPKWNTYTHQQMHVDWLYRAFQGGLRLVVVHAVNNEALCSAVKEIRDFSGVDCSDMSAVDRQLDAAWHTQAHVPWFRIARSAAEARQIIASGKLAVVLGIEVDFLFNCRPSGNCTPEHVKGELKRYYDKGVRHIHPIHLFDNGFGGAAIYDEILNFGNAFTNGEFFQTRECGPAGFNFKITGALTWLAGVFGLPAPPDSGFTADCNARALTPLGGTLLNKLMSRKMIIDVDHLSELAMNQALTQFEGFDYPVISGHTGFLDISNFEKRHEAQKTGPQVDRIRALGGFVSPLTHQGSTHHVRQYGSKVANDCSNSSKTFAQAYLYAVDRMRGGAVGLGTDWNGFAGQPGPRFGLEDCPGDLLPSFQGGGVSYPFSLFGMTGALGKSVTGDRTFDFNVDGLAHAGMLPDFVEDLRSLGLSNELVPLFNSAEAYLRMWEKAESKNLFPPSLGFTVLPAPNAAGWNNTVVTVAATGSEHASGDGWPVQQIQYSATGAQSITPTTVASATAFINIGAEGLTTIQGTARDDVGNTSALTTATVKIDTKAPSIAIVSPTAERYVLNQPLAAVYSCADGGSGVAACAGPVPSGSNLMTSAAGSYTFAVTASDHVGNASTASVSYSVSYDVCLLYDPAKAKPTGSTISLRLQLCDAADANVSSSAVVVNATGVTRVSTEAPGVLEASGNANPDNNFRFDPDLGAYVFNLKTTGFASGTYRLTFTVTGDPKEHAIEFQLK